MSDKKLPVYITVRIEPEGLKKVVEQGRLMEFVGTLSNLTAEHIQAQIVNQIASAGVGIGSTSGGLSFSVNFDTEPGYGTPPRHWGWPKALLGEAINQELISVRQTEQTR